MATTIQNLLVFLSLAAITSVISSHNITAILEGMPQYSQFNSLLSQTRLADEINSRQTVTVLALDNAAVSTLTPKHPLSAVKNALSLLVLLDYYDPVKIHQIENGTTLTTTLYQTTGNAQGNLGFVNVTDLKGGKVGFGSAAPGSKLDSTYTKSIKQIPYNISVLEISSPIIAPGILTAAAPSVSDVNITSALEKAGCKIFANLLLTSGVIKMYESAMVKSLTIFAPNDEAFKAKDVPDLTKLTNADLVSLLEYHAASVYSPSGSLKADKNPIATLASNGAGKYELTATTAGDEITLHTGFDSSRVAETVLDAMPLVIFTVDSVLMPVELFGTAPSPAPVAEPVSALSPSPVANAPSPAPTVEAPSPLADSPPAPPVESPEGSPSSAPADSPAGSENSTADNVAVLVTVSTLFTFVVTVVCSLFIA